MNLPAGCTVTLWKQAPCSQQGSDQALGAGAVLQACLCTAIKVYTLRTVKKIKRVPKRKVYTVPQIFPTKAFSHDWDVSQRCMSMLSTRTCRKSSASLWLIAVPAVMGGWVACSSEELPSPAPSLQEISGIGPRQESYRIHTALSTLLSWSCFSIRPLVSIFLK